MFDGIVGMGGDAVIRSNGVLASRPDAACLVYCYDQPVERVVLEKSHAGMEAGRAVGIDLFGNQAGAGRCAALDTSDSPKGPAESTAVVKILSRLAQSVRHGRSAVQHVISVGCRVAVSIGLSQHIADRVISLGCDVAQSIGDPNHPILYIITVTCGVAVPVR